MTERMEIKDLNRVEMGKRIRERRELLKMSRDELARRLDVTSKFIADLEYGEKGASVKNLYRLKQIPWRQRRLSDGWESVQSKQDGAAKRCSMKISWDRSAYAMSNSFA